MTAVAVSSRSSTTLWTANNMDLNKHMNNLEEHNRIVLWEVDEVTGQLSIAGVHDLPEDIKLVDCFTRIGRIWRDNDKKYRGIIKHITLVLNGDEYRMERR